MEIVLPLGFADAFPVVASLPPKNSVCSFKLIPNLKTKLKHASIDVKFIFDSARLGLFSTANILQIADVALQVVFLLLLPCF